MFEYVITGGPGIMVEHGTGHDGDILAIVNTLQEWEELIVAPTETKIEDRFH